MNKSLLIVAVCSGLPGCAAQAAAPASAAPAQASCAMPEHPAPASGALPARAGTGPEPQRGAVAPSTRVVSHVVTPSMRAMEKASAAQEAQRAGGEKTPPAPCEPIPVDPAPKGSKG